MIACGKKIKIFSLPLTKNLKGFMPLKERLFQEGGSMNVFGENFNFEGKKFKSEMYYDLFGINIKFLLDNKLLELLLFKFLENSFNSLIKLFVDF